MIAENSKQLNIQFNDLNAQWKCIKEGAIERIDQLFEKSYFIGGKDIALFESNFSKWNNNQFASGCSNGTDAIKLALQAMELKGNIGFFIPANTYIATILASENAYLDAKMHLIDCDKHFQIDTNILEEALNKERDKYDIVVILPVHLYGHTVNIKEIQRLAEKYECIIMEDASQAHGALGEDNIKAGSFGKAAAFSLYPGKNLGAAGDAGVITTNDEELNNKIRALRNLGSEKKYFHDVKGYNNRMDTFQAIIVDEKLKHIDKWNDNRNAVVNCYNQNINNDNLLLPVKADYCNFHVYHIYCVRVMNGKREQFQSYLKENGITTVIHYPIPIESTGAYSYLNVFNENTRKWADEIISLPIHPFMKEEEVEFICHSINNWES